MSKIKCFFLEPTERAKKYFRRFTHTSYEENACPITKFYHQAMAFSGIVEDDASRSVRPCDVVDRAGWPTHCDCGYEFRDDDEWQVFLSKIYVRKDTGEEMTLKEAPVGAMWHADWLPERYRGADGHSLMVKTPGGDWLVDGRANNCTNPNDWEHRCWVRSGEPPRVTVGKGGNTCRAGAGSIAIGSYHGFLKDGYLT